MSIVKYPVALVCTFLWIGFVGGISFLEAWLKFRAPGITVPLGLGIGRLVFSALNKVEWVLAVAIFFNLLLGSDKLLKWENGLYLLPVLMLIIQTIWLLPALDARAELHIQHLPVPASNIHFYYVALEFAKVLCLFTFGIIQFKTPQI